MRVQRIVPTLVIGVAFFCSAVGCKPRECKDVMAAAAPIQKAAEDGNADELASHVKALKQAATGSRSGEISWLAQVAEQLSDHVAAGKKAKAGSMPGYSDDRARYLTNFVDARREVARVCK